MTSSLPKPPSAPIEETPVDTPSVTVGTYAKCKDCGIDLADRDAITAHGQETMAPTGELGVIARGHTVSIVNPTDEERRAQRVRSAVGYLLDRLYEELQEDVDRGDFTAADVSANLWMFDLRDGWDEWVAEGDDA